MDYQAPQTPLGAQTPHAHPAYVAVITTLVVAVAIGGYLALAYATGWWPFTASPSVSPSPSPSASASPTTTPDPATADWKTYTNAEHGFEFRYPKEWVGGQFVSGNPLDFAVRFGPPDNASDAPVGAGVQVRNQKQGETLESIRQEYGAYMTWRSGAQYIGGQPAIIGQSGEFAQSFGYVIYKGKVFTLQNESITNQQILASFKFIDATTAGWTNFSSRYFTLSFKVPPGFEVQDQPNVIMVTRGPYMQNEFGGNNVFMRLDRYDSQYTKQYFMEQFRGNHTDVRTSAIVVDGFSFTRMDGVGAYEKGPSGSRELQVLFDRSTLGASEYPGTLSEPPFDAIAVTEQILSTFRFSR